MVRVFKLDQCHKHSNQHLRTEAGLVVLPQVLGLDEAQATAWVVISISNQVKVFPNLLSPIFLHLIYCVSQASVAT